MFLTSHSSAFLLHDVRVVKNVACLSSLLVNSGCPRGSWPMAIVEEVLPDEHVTACVKLLFEPTMESSRGIYESCVC